MNTTVFLAVLFCLLTGTVAAILWPRRRTPEARAFIAVAVVTAVIAAVANFWKKSARMR